MSELNELYQQMILDHNRRPRNFRKLENADRKAEGFNPLCGDHLTLYVNLDGERIVDIAFEGSGCAISKASASIMTDVVKGKSRGEAEELFEKMHRMLTGKEKADLDQMGKLAAFSGVSEFPARVKCATLAWHTLNAALDQKSDPVTTE